MFFHHLLEVLDRLERDVVFFVAKIHESAGVRAVLWNHHLDGAIWIDARTSRRLTTCDQDHCKDECDKPRHIVILFPQSREKNLGSICIHILQSEVDQKYFALLN